MPLPYPVAYSLPYSVKIVLREPGRFLPAVLAIAFSAVLVSMQSGMLLGFLQTSSRPVDRVGADLWIGSRDMPALGFSHPIETTWYGRIASQPEVAEVEPYLYGITMWHRDDGGLEQCYVVGTRLGEDSIGRLVDLTQSQRAQLARVGAVGLYDPDRKLLGIRGGEGTIGEISGVRVEIAALIQGPTKAAGLMPGLICSLRTAHRLLPSLRSDQATYLIARCHDPADAERVARRLRARYPDMAAYTRAEMALRTQQYWLTKTRAGLVLAFSAILGLLVGAVITSQTFYSATAAAWREFSVLRALGIPARHVVGLLLIQALLVGALGILAAWPFTLLLVEIGIRYNVQAVLPLWLVAAVAVVTLGTAMLAGLVALRSLQLVEPGALLR
ncbi:MAG: ABC transporter permease [Gemmataceae bacterium]